MTPTRTCVSRLGNSFCQSVFRGGIVDNCKRFRFTGSGYSSMPKEQDGHFQIQSARHLAGIFAALEDPFVRSVHLIGATQVLKSMAGECWIIYHFEHFRLPTLVLFEDEDKARKFASERLITTVKDHPGMQSAIVEQIKDNRFKITQTKIKLPGASLFVEGLNEGNVSTFSWPIIWISEAWQHGNDGLLFKAFKRADRFPDTHKILNESQASLVGTDLHTAVKDVHQVPLTWRCPACDGEQTWEWRHWSFKRPDDFTPRPQKSPRNPPPLPGSFAGMSWGLDDAKAEDNRTIEEKARSAHWRCIWCDHRINDTRAERQAIAETYSQDYRLIANGHPFTPREVCFTLPFEANVDNRFAKTVAKFLSAKSAKDFAAGGKRAMEDWYLSDRAFFYDPAMEYKTVEVSPGSYNPSEYKKLMGDEFHSVNMVVDCQQDQDVMDRTGQSITGWFWYIVRAVDKLGNSQQITRGFAKSWDEWIAVQHLHKVPNDRVCICIGKWPTQIMQMAAQQREIIRIDKPLPPFYIREKIVTWYMMDTDQLGRKNFIHADKSQKPWSPPQSVLIPLLDKDGKSKRIPLKKIRFDKDTFHLQLDALRSGAPGMPKFEIVSREFLDDKTKAAEVGVKTYEQQMSSQYYDPQKRKYVELRVDDHYQWWEIVFLVRCAMDGLYGAGLSGQ